MRAPQGDLSIIPVHVSGLSQSSTPLDITTAFFDAAPLPSLGGPRKTMMSHPCGRAMCHACWRVSLQPELLGLTG